MRIGGVSVYEEIARIGMVCGFVPGVDEGCRRMME
jgi:hypothetical protein